MFFSSQESETFSYIPIKQKIYPVVSFCLLRLYNWVWRGWLYGSLKTSSTLLDLPTSKHLMILWLLIVWLFSLSLSKDKCALDLPTSKDHMSILDFHFADPIEKQMKKVSFDHTKFFSYNSYNDKPLFKIKKISLLCI